MYIKPTNAFARSAVWAIEALSDLRLDIEEVALERQQNGHHYLPKLAALLNRIERKLDLVKVTTERLKAAARADFGRKS